MKRTHGPKKQAQVNVLAAATRYGRIMNAPGVADPGKAIRAVDALTKAAVEYEAALRDAKPRPIGDTPPPHA